MLHRVRDERTIVRTIKIRKADYIGHVLRKNCLLKRVIVGRIGGRIEVTGRRGRRRKQQRDTFRKREDIGN